MSEGVSLRLTPGREGLCCCHKGQNRVRWPFPRLIDSIIFGRRHGIPLGVAAKAFQFAEETGPRGWEGLDGETEFKAEGCVINIAVAHHFIGAIGEAHKRTGEAPFFDVVMEIFNEEINGGASYLL